MNEQSRTANDATDPNIDDTAPDDDLGGNQERAYAAEHAREVIQDAHEAAERATERLGPEPGEKR